MITPKSIESIIENTRNWIIKYNPLILYKWITILSIHPSNQIYQIRLEFFLAIMTTIKVEEYQNEELNYEEFSSFMQKFKEHTDSLFFSIEDFIPFSQLKLIPYFYEKEKYYFFYGHVERMFEQLRILEKLYLLDIDMKYPELLLMRGLFKQVLKYQTGILNKLIQIEESREELKSQIYVPTNAFFKEFEDILLLSSNEIIDSNFILEFSSNRSELKDKFKNIVDGTFFNSLYLKFSDIKFCVALPSIQIEVLYKIFEIIIRKSTSKNLIEVPHNNLKKVLKNVIDTFFHLTDCFKAIYNGKKECISNDIDGIVLAENILILFKFVDVFSKSKSTEKLTKCYRFLESFTQKLRSEDFLYLRLKNSYGYKVPTVELKFLRIIIYQSIDLSPEVLPFNFETNSQTTVVKLMDLISIFELTTSSMSFLKFIEEKYSIPRILTFDQMNIFAAFHINNESLPFSGESILFLDPHMWSNFYNNYLYEKYQDSIYELVEFEFPSKYNKISNWNKSKNIYECFDSRTLDSAMVIKHKRQLFWIFNPRIHPNLSMEDLEFHLRVITPLYADYINRIIEEFINLINSYFSFQRYGIYPIPVKVCPNNPQFTQFKEIYQQVNEKDPIIAKSFLNKNFILISMIFYDVILWSEKFLTSETNDNSIYAIKQLVYSIIANFEPNLSEREINDKAIEFVKSCFMEEDRDYYLETLPARNEDIKAYPLYDKFNPTNQEKVIKEVESYLMKLQVKQEHLTTEESKQLFNKIYKEFYKRFKDLLFQYDISILFYAYRQRELIEGKRYLIRLEAGMRKTSQLDYDYRESFLKEYDEISKLSTTQRFIIENILNSGIKGDKKINKIEYSYLLSLAFYLISISQISDFSHSKVIEYSINIKDLYKFDEIRDKSLFDYDAFKEVDFRGKLESTRVFYNGIKSLSQNEIDKVDLPYDEKKAVKRLENAFQSEFSFTFTNLMRIIWILSSTDYKGKDISFFPTILADKADLIKNLEIEYRKNFGDLPIFNGTLVKEIKDKEIEMILEFVSLDFSSYQNKEILLYLKLMRSRNRLSIRPLVKINSQFLIGKECCNIAFELWRRDIFAGIFPYKIDKKGEVSLALNQIHSLQDKKFEDECGEIAKNALGEGNCLIRLKNFNRISEQLPKRPSCGEIDLIALNPNTRTCFILDAKNYYLKLHPYDIKNEIDRFITNNDSDLKKVRKKEKFVIDNFKYFLDYFQIIDQLDWKFKKGFIIKYNFPTKYIKNLDVDFVFQDKLGTYLKC